MIYECPKKITEVNAVKTTENIISHIIDNEEVILDFQNTMYISSAGVAVIISVAKECLKRKNDFSVVNTQPLVTKTLELVGLDSIIDMNEKPKILKK